MATWKALNLDSDNEEEDEIDDTKEIQIEEALKLYQNALKFHSEGPSSFDKAAEAYKLLFESEIFKYPESLSEYKRHELYGDSLVFDSILEDDFDAGPVQSAGGNESAPNTLPQILHLSYKNHGQFMLETMQYWIRQHGTGAHRQGSDHILSVLTYFAEALDKEDTDLDLWLRTASVAALLGSRRITRFCLEAVLDGNDELYDSLLRVPGLEEGFAGQQLRELIAKLEDSLSLMQPSFSKMKRKNLPEVLKKRLNPYPFAPLPGEVDRSAPLPTLYKQPERVILHPSKWDWAGVGESILRHYIAEQSGLLGQVPAGSAITIQIPSEESPVADRQSETTTLDFAGPAQLPEEPSQDGIADSVSVPVPKGDTAHAMDDEDTVMEGQDKDGVPKTEEAGSATPTEAALPPSRKRSTDSAGLPETADGGRIRSKRIRAREVTDSTVGGEPAKLDAAKALEDQLWQYTHADQCLSEVLNDIFARLGVEGLGSPKQLREFVTGSSATSAVNSIDKAACDIYVALQSSGSKIAPVLLSAEPVDLGGASREAGLNAFLGYSKSSTAQACVKPILQSEKLTSFALRINDGWFSAKEVAFAWIEVLLSPGFLPVPSDANTGSKSSYMRYRWAEDLKRHLVQVIVNVDDFIYERMKDRVEGISNKTLQAKERSKEYELSETDAAQVETVQTLFELHLDIFSLIKHPHSGVDATTQTVQKDRLDRWAALAREAIQLRSFRDAHVDQDELALRHVWASVFQMSVNEDVLPDHVIYAMEELKDIFRALNDRTIEVQNNAVMSELSTTAIDRELVRISMKDFFLKVFDADEKDPVAVIESLEPILEPLPEAEPPAERQNDGHNGDNRSSQSPSTVGHDDQITESQVRPSPYEEMRKFLDSASVNLRLSLWQRLREAYEAIEYPPKVLSCYLRSIETLVGEFTTSAYQECSIPERHVKLTSRLRIADEVVVKVVQIIRNEKDPFECLSYEHMQSSMTAISHLLRILIAADFLQDLIQVGHMPMPRVEGMPSGTFTNMASKLRDMQLRLWILQYYLMKEGISQTPMAFPIPSDDEFEYIRHVHHATGVRGFCHFAGRAFLRLAKDEILRLHDVTETGNRDTELSQLLYDLYGLKTFIDPLDRLEFGSLPDILDKKTATNLLPFIMSQAEYLSIKDLAKHNDLKVTIDKVHGALGRPKAIEDVSLNRRILTSYFKSPINPVSLFDCLKGVGSLSTRHIPAEAAVPASKGWYFLMGNINLNKFKSQKKEGPRPTEDLNFSQAFFLQDLEYSVERWETWYRLAQANDAQLEEAASFNAEKINSNSIELINFQRAAIHCYTMATACAVRDADPTPEFELKVSRMYTDFGTRIYASSREPFNMSAFAVREPEQKYYSGNVTQIVYQNVPFAPLSTYTAWKFASVLFKRAIRGNPEHWWNHYMLSKCLWKMYVVNTDVAEGAVNQGQPVPSNKGPTWEEVIDAVVYAIETQSEKKGRNGEPLLEPHYKLVSLVHKLFQRKVINHAQGPEILQHTSYAQNISGPESVDDWERYILAVLKALRTADKQGWHHRIIARAAHVIWDDSDHDVMVAHGAKHEMTQMFTKGMAIQVWKPENERPGRHFVYTSRYTKFLMDLLNRTGDKANLEALARRVRKKPADFFEHSKLWQELCLQYLKLLRRIGKIPDGQEDTVFKAINYDEFSVQAARLEAWCQNPSTQHPILDVLRDAVELKRLNGNATKPLLIDDLIGDTYALLYTTVGPTLQPLPSEKQQDPQLQQGQGLVSGLGHPTTGSPYISAIMQMQIDGSSDTNHNVPFNMYHPSQLQPQPQTQPTEAVTKPKAKTVGRREIARRAEACAQKPAGAPVPATTSIPIRSPSITMHATLPFTSRSSPEKAVIDPDANTSGTEQLQVPNSGTATAAASVTNVESSAPASAHANESDDESDLSELDESEVQQIAQEVDAQAVTSRPLFPNLMANKNKVKQPNVENEAEEDEVEGDVEGADSNNGEESEGDGGEKVGGSGDNDEVEE